MFGLITQDVIDGAMDYATYVAMVKQLVEGYRTAGSEGRDIKHQMTGVNYETILDLERSVILEKETINLLQRQHSELVWVFITEPWCLDSANALPVIHKMAELNSNIELKIVLKSAPPYIIESFPTNNSLSTPKTISLDKFSLITWGTWGPRPEPLQAIVRIWLKDMSKEEKEGDSFQVLHYQKLIREWFKRDATKTMQAEMVKSLLH